MINIGKDFLNEHWNAKCGTQFNFKRLNAIEAFACLEIIRVTLGTKIGDIDVSLLTFDQDTEDETKKMAALKEFMQLVLKIPPAIVKELQKRMWREVYFQNATTSRTPQALSGNEAEAFNKGSPLDIYQVTARSFAINFFPFFEELISMLPVKAPATQSQDTET